MSGIGVKKSPSSKTIVEKSIDFEVSREQSIRSSERRAWIVAILATLLSFVLGAGYLFVMPLKEKIPYLITADAYTGTSTLTKLPDDFNVSVITANEAINKANVASYIVARESYDWDLWSQKDSNTIFAMSGPVVLKAYKEAFTDPRLAPDVVYGKKSMVRVKIKTLVLTGADEKGIPNGATVRFDRIVIDKTQDRASAAESFVATMAFEYKANLKMPEDYRVQNPLGFRVIAYRTDPEFAAQGRDVMARELSNTATPPPPMLAPSPPAEISRPSTK